MALKVNRRSLFAEDFFSSFFTSCYRNLSTTACDPRRFFLFAVAAVRLHQTANQGQNRLALCLGRPAAGTLAPRPRKSCVPHAGYSKRGDRVPRNGRSSMSARREGSHAAKVVKFRFQCIKPSRAGGQSKRRGRERWRTGVYGARCPSGCDTRGRARPWLASVRPSGSPARSAKLMARASVDSSYGFSGHQRRGSTASASQGTG
jgi:hypothetical protein